MRMRMWSAALAVAVLLGALRGARAAAWKPITTEDLARTAPIVDKNADATAGRRFILHSVAGASRCGAFLVAVGDVDKARVFFERVRSAAGEPIVLAKPPR
jgi:hypothetical protein